MDIGNIKIDISEPEQVNRPKISFRNIEPNIFELRHYESCAIFHLRANGCNTFGRIEFIEHTSNRFDTFNHVSGGSESANTFKPRSQEA